MVHKSLRLYPAGMQTRSVASCGMTHFIVLALALMMANADAGPLRDWRQQRQQVEAGDLFAEDATQASTSALKPLELAYGADARQKLDVYLPPQARNAPVIVIVHGGAWRTGDKRMRSVVQNKAARWLPRGLIVVSVNYRLLPEIDPLRQVVDVAQALTLVQAKAAEWGGDPARVVLMGHSAGAHLVSLLAAAPEKARSLGVKPWLGTIALDSAAYDISAIMSAAHYRFYNPAFGADPEYWRDASPLQQLSAGAMPILAVCSSIRPDHPCDQAQQFAEKGRQLGVRVELLAQAQSHRQINQNLGLPGAYTAAVEAFMSSLDAGLQQRLKP